MSKIIESIYPDTWQKTRGIYSPAKKIDLGNCYLIFVSGQQVEKNENNEAITSDVTEQTESIFRQLNNILNACGASIDNVVKAQIFVTDMNDFKEISKVRDKWFGNCKPISTLIEVNGMTRKGAKVEIEVTAILEK